MKVSGGTFKKRGYEEIRDSKLLEILKRNLTRTWLKYEYISKCPHFLPKRPTFFQNNS
jgi:hypothetical protein